MKILGWDTNLTYYTLAGIGIGIGTGIIFSNLFSMSLKFGFVVLIMSSVLSFYIWHKKGVKQIFMK